MTDVKIEEGKDYVGIHYGPANKPSFALHLPKVFDQYDIVGLNESDKIKWVNRIAEIVEVYRKAKSPNVDNLSFEGTEDKAVDWLSRLVTMRELWSDYRQNSLLSIRDASIEIQEVGRIDWTRTLRTCAEINQVRHEHVRRRHFQNHYHRLTQLHDMTLSQVNYYCGLDEYHYVEPWSSLEVVEVLEESRRFCRSHREHYVFELLERFHLQSIQDGTGSEDASSLKINHFHRVWEHMVGSALHEWRVRDDRVSNLFARTYTPAEDESQEDDVEDEHLEEYGSTKTRNPRKWSPDHLVDLEGIEKPEEGLEASPNYLLLDSKYYKPDAGKIPPGLGHDIQKQILYHMLLSASRDSDETPRTIPDAIPVDKIANIFVLPNSESSSNKEVTYLGTHRLKYPVNEKNRTTLGTVMLVSVSFEALADAYVNEASLPWLRQKLYDVFVERVIAPT